MSALAPPPRREATAAPLLAVTGLAVVAAGLVAGTETFAAVVAGCLLLSAIAVGRPSLPWERVLGVLLIVILFIPIRRYRFPGDLPFQLEPYRLLVAVILAGWAASLLADSRVRLRRSGFEGPIAAVVLAIIASIATNPARFAAHESNVIKSLTFFLSFVLVFYLVVSVVRRPAIAEFAAKTLVAGGAVVALLAILESRTGASPFTRLDSVLPFLVIEPAFEPIERGSTLRATGPAEHPIALGAALVMLVPLAVYLVRVASRKWWLALFALTVGVLATVSRTGVMMLIAAGLVFLCLRPRETKRLWPLLLPLVVAVHFAVPGTLGALKNAFLPEGGLIAQQRSTAFGCDSSGRIADIGPTLSEVSKRPFFGYGYGTRVVTGPESNACVLDDQWLGTLYEVGFLGALAWLWLFLAVLRRLGRAAKSDPSPRGWLLAGVTASVSSFAVGMATFDALGFVQVTFLLFIVLSLGAAMARGEPGHLRAAETRA
jgi:polysaccharide biosynthesis protein PslJ